MEENETDIEIIEEQPEEKVQEKKKHAKHKKKKNKSKADKEVKKEETGTNIGWIILGIIIIGAIACLIIFKDKIFPQQEKDDIIVKIDGVPIYKSEIESAYNRLQLTYGTLITKELVLNQSITRILLTNEAKRKGIEITEKDVDTEIENLRKQLPADVTLEQVLSSQNMTLEEARLEVKNQVYVQKLFDILIIQDDIQKYYDENIVRFTANEGEIRVRHILVETKQQAENLLAQLKEGADFAELAKENSIDTTSAVRGGDLGFFDENTMVENFTKIAFNLKVGEISGSVETQFGFHIIKRESPIVPLEDVKEVIQQTLLVQKLPEYIEELKQKANFEYITPLKEETIDLQKPITEQTTLEDNTATTGFVSFKDSGDTICMENGKPIIRMFSTTSCPHCNWIGDTFDKVAKEYQDKGKIIARHFQFNTGDDLMTSTTETAVPQSEREIYQKYNPESTVPTFIFGCKYVRIGNFYETEGNLDKEEQEFRNAIDALLA